MSGQSSLQYFAIYVILPKSLRMRMAAQENPGKVRMRNSKNLGSKRDLMTLPEVAEHLRIGRRTAYGWAKASKIPAFKIGASWRFDRKDVDRWVEEQKLIAHQKRNILLGDRDSETRRIG